MEGTDIVICIINALASAISTISNATVFVAILKTPSLHTPTNILLCSLAASDFAVGFLVQPTFIAAILSEYREPVHEFFKYCFLFFVLVSLSTVVLITVDRFVALYWHLRYQSKVTVQRTVVALVLVWVLCVPSTFIYYKAGGRKSRFIIALIWLAGILATILFCHYKTFKIIQHHRRQIATQRQAFPIPMARQGRSIMTVWYIQGMFIICNVPYVWSKIASLYLFRGKPFLRLMRSTCLTLLFLNSSLNPFLYGYRSREIRKAILNILKWSKRRNTVTSGS